MPIACLQYIRDSIQNEALAQLGDLGDDDDALWEAEEMANERRGARQLQAIMRSTGMIIAMDPESDTDTESDTADLATFHDDEVGGERGKNATNGIHNGDGVENLVGSEHERLQCVGRTREEEVRGGGGLQEWGPEVNSFLDHLGVHLERDGTVGRDGEMHEGEGVRLEDVVKRLAVLSARREGETPVLEGGSCGEDGMGRGMAERFAMLTERGLETQV